MKLQKLEIELQAYGENVGKYTAEISYEGVRGGVNLLLDAQVSEAVLLVIGPVITKFATESAKQLEQELLNSVQESRKQPTIEVV